MKASARIRQHSQPNEVVSSWTGELYIFSHWRPKKWTHRFILLWDILQVWKIKSSRKGSEPTNALLLISCNVLTCIAESCWGQQALWRKSMAMTVLIDFTHFAQRDLNVLKTLGTYTDKTDVNSLSIFKNTEVPYQARYNSGRIGEEIAENKSSKIIIWKIFIKNPKNIYLNLLNVA